MPLRLSLFPFDGPVLADGPIPARLSIENSGASTMQVPAGLGSSPFEYRIYEAETADLVQVASLAEEVSSRTSFGDMPRPAPFTLPLGAGATTSLRDDPSLLLSAPLAPGRYQLEARYRDSVGETAVSGRVNLEIAVSKPVMTAQRYSESDRRIISAEWHQSKPGSPILLRQRDTVSSPVGRFSDVRALDQAGPIESAAIATVVASGLPDGWRWIAWTEGEDLVAGAVIGGDFVYPVQRSPSRLTNPVLLPDGYAVGSAGAIFSVAGDSTLRLARVAAGRESSVEWLNIRLDEMPAGVPQMMCRWDPEKEPELHYAWTVEYKGATMIAVAQVDPATGEGVSPVRTVYVTLRPVVSFEIPATVGLGQAAVVQVLLGPWHDEKEFVYVTFDLASPSELTSRKYPAITEAADVFLLPHQVETASPPILGVSPEAIWASRGGTDGWRCIATGDIDVASVRLWALGSRRQTCTWFDQAAGYKSLTLSERPAD